MNQEAFPYPVAERALKKWSENNLTEQKEQTSQRHFVFLYQGSLCHSGGIPYSALFHVVAEEAEGAYLIHKAWIEVPDDQRAAASEMCSAKGGGPEKTEAFFRKLLDPADFCGQEIDRFLLEKRSLNFAGCLCSSAHINQKWQMVLSAVRYVLEKDRSM